MDDAALRVRLEGRAERLEAAALRYRTLLDALKALRWRVRVAQVLEVLEAIASEQRAVDEALALVQRRAAAEGWPPGQVLETATRAHTLRAELARRVARRLGDASTGVLTEDLSRLLRLAAAEPRRVPASARLDVARAALPRSLPELATAQRFGAALERAFDRPSEERGPLVLTAADWDELEALWPQGAEVLDVLWRRLESADASGGVARVLRERARRPGATEPADGMSILAHAEFWRTLATARVEQLAATRVEPARLRPGEAFPVFGWLLRRSSDDRATLPLADARAGLLELAHVLSGTAQTAPGAHPWEALESLAARADGDPSDEDWRRLREALLHLVRATTRPGLHLSPVRREGQQTPPRLSRDCGLRELVRALRAAVADDAGGGR